MNLNLKPAFKALTSLALIMMVSTSYSSTSSKNTDLDKAINGKHRSEKFIKRDVYRHPKETLTFFDVQPQHTVVEIWPGGGWYAEILAPYLKENGQYYSAGFSLTAKRTPQWRKNFANQLNQKFESQPDIYGKAIVTGLSIPEDPEIAPDNSADRVLTFRNVHNWMKGDYAQEVFDSMFKALKKGGVLGVVEHRAKPGTSIEDMITSGYVTEEHVMMLAKKSGFKFLERSEINQNIKDTTDHPKGVWTLPPTLRLKEKNKDHYLTIGESDRMTLKFIKP